MTDQDKKPGLEARIKALLDQLNEGETTFDVTRSYGTGSIQVVRNGMPHSTLASLPKAEAFLQGVIAAQ